MEACLFRDKTKPTHQETNIQGVTNIANIASIIQGYTVSYGEETYGDVMYGKVSNCHQKKNMLFFEDLSARY